jgi:hypothetical protein
MVVWRQNALLRSVGLTGTLTFKSWSSLAGNPVATNPATFDTVNSIPVLAFPNGVTSGTFFVDTLPQGAVFAAGLKVNIFWVSSLTAGNVTWGASFEPTQSALSITTDRWGTQVTVNATVSATASVLNAASITVPLANLGTMAPENLYRLRIQRMTGDTLAGVAQLVSVNIEAA